MKLVKEINALRSHLKEITFKAAQGGKQLQVGFVPTMGYLHAGHASLLRQARQENDIVVLSIFVNPIQFGANEDLDKYPRDFEADMTLAGQMGVDIVFMPTPEEMYPTPTKTHVKVSQLTDLLCGASRPGHFDGVTTVVSKLFHIVSPNVAYFGQKDAQQLAVITQMVHDLNLDVKIVPCPIVREPDGLALSSRNVYLSDDERQAALVLSQSLELAKRLTSSSNSVNIGQLRDSVISHINAEPLAKIDYVTLTSFPELEELEDELKYSEIQGDVLLALAVKFGNTRLIDNVILTKKGL
ncbi:pantoate--beta-alanine ligase [Paenibacillus turicensis]|uniref:Pantothenate synthetase n=1 Tax=Paenibacillus turicensis TaxID=160487 RepID=A0ABS4FYP7_9BACL|nr:pantoate--beta-alanine ligase [Paenibacillus turicensis]MBP1907703.1 pantoate--beta-alanine ligase [Paenibacillus turicensis]